MYEAKVIENSTTIKYMKEYGWKIVRGGDLVATEKFEILRILIRYGKKKYKLSRDFMIQLIDNIPEERKPEWEYYYRWVFPKSK